MDSSPSKTLVPQGLLLVSYGELGSDNEEIIIPAEFSGNEVYSFSSSSSSSRQLGAFVV